jgi:hypothetical protein
LTIFIAVAAAAEFISAVAALDECTPITLFFGAGW